MAHLVEYWRSMLEALGWVLSTTKEVVVTYTLNLSIWEEKARDQKLKVILGST